MEYGLSVVLSLVEGEERSMHVVHPASKIKACKDEVLVLLSNVPQGSVTGAVDVDGDKIWPTLHVHFDKKGKPRGRDLLAEVPVLDSEGDSATDTDESTDDDVTKPSCPIQSSPARGIKRKLN